MANTPLCVCVCACFFTNSLAKKSRFRWKKFNSNFCFEFNSIKVSRFRIFTKFSHWLISKGEVKRRLTRLVINHPAQSNYFLIRSKLLSPFLKLKVTGYLAISSSSLPSPPRDKRTPRHRRFLSFRLRFHFLSPDITGDHALFTAERARSKFIRTRFLVATRGVCSLDLPYDARVS